jgi:hypothetical protein
VSSPAVVSIDDVLLALRSVPGVRSADIGDDDEGGAGLLRLDLAADVDEVEVAASVGRLLRERFGLGVDAGQVQMVEAAKDFAAAPLIPSPSGEPDLSAPGDIRVAVMNVTSAGRKVVVTIVLRRNGREFRGEAPGTTTSNGVFRAVAEATLRAIEELTEDAVIGRLEVLEVAEQVLVTLVLDVDGVEITASAQSEIHSDPRQAVVRAVLAAVQPHLPE